MCALSVGLSGGKVFLLRLLVLVCIHALPPGEDGTRHRGFGADPQPLGQHRVVGAVERLERVGVHVQFISTLNKGKRINKEVNLQVKSHFPI